MPRKKQDPRATSLAKARAALAEKRQKEKNGTLLERAMLYHHRQARATNGIGKQERDLALAYAHGRVTAAQVMHALGLKSGTPYVWLCRVLSAMVANR